ncbi:endolytic transglycosylase MltG [Nonomuraea terrae]|uniref:Endolytic murein transglycosylase n=1 Tax=Nonomuraea terrae TaxID=2530383 RepID=A0A4R4YMM3_9ACTN|nr:endolytic transglycosylase MltG [Nonomuraea terrae]
MPPDEAVSAEQPGGAPSHAGRGDLGGAHPGQAAGGPDQPGDPGQAAGGTDQPGDAEQAIGSPDQTGDAERSPSGAGQAGGAGLKGAAEQVGRPERSAGGGGRPETVRRTVAEDGGRASEGGRRSGGSQAGASFDDSGDYGRHEGGGRFGGSRRGASPESREVQGAARRRRALRKAGLLSAGLVAGVLVIGAGAVALLKPYLSPDDFEGTGSAAVTVRIAPGSSAAAIGSTLEEAGVVASAESFVRATEDRAVSDRLRPGHYRLRKGMAATAALDLLLAPASRVVKRVTVPEGLRVSEVFARVAKQAGIPLKELQSVDKELVGLPEYARGLEGFLFPATYEIEPGDTAVDVLAAMVERFTQAARHVGLEEKAKQVKLDPLEAVTVASLIQAEGGTDEDYPKISRVIYNRLAKDAPLEIDSTVLYAQNRRTLKVTESDTKVSSPYNTYRRKGLPPGPIANPGEKALIAALNPAKGDWYWFVTTDPAHRITKFTDKESEFVRYREELNKNLGTN